MKGSDGVRRIVVGRGAIGPLLAPLLVVLLLVTVGWGGQAASVSKHVTLTIWQEGSVEPQLAAGIKAFNASHKDVTVNTQVIASASYDTKLRLSVMSDNPPQIFMTFGGGLIFGQFLPGSHLLDLSKIDPQIKQTFLPTVLAPVTWKGGVYGIPFTGVQPDELFYNKQAFSKAGIKSPPSTWNQLLSDVRTLKSHHVIPIAQGNEHWAEMMWLEYIVAKLGGEQWWKAVTNGDAHAWSSPVVQKGWSLVHQLMATQPFEPGWQGIQYGNGQPTQLVASGQAAMELQTAGEVNNMQQKTPSFASSDNLGFFAFPTVPGAPAAAQKNVAGNPSVYLAVSSALPSADRSALATFCSFLMSQKYERDVLNVGQVPGTQNIGKFLSSLNKDGMLNPPVIRRWDNFAYKQADSAPYFQQSWDQALPAGLSQDMTTDVGQVFSGSMTPGGFASDLDKDQHLASAQPAP